MGKSLFDSVKEAIWGRDEPRWKKVARIAGIVFIVLVVLIGAALLIAYFAFDVEIGRVLRNHTEETVVGKGVYLPNQNLFESPAGTAWVEGSFSKCIKVDDFGGTDNKEALYESTNTILKETSTTFGLSGSYSKKFSLGGSLNYASSGLDVTKEDSMTFLRMFSRPYLRATLDKACYFTLPINKDLEKSFKALPILIKNPEQAESWSSYDSLLKNFGSHFPTREFFGARFTHWTTALKTDKLSEEDMKVGACGDFDGFVKGGNLNVSVCAGHKSHKLNAEKSSLLKFKTQVIGGSPETNNLMAHKSKRNEGLLKKLLDEYKYRQTSIAVKDFLHLGDYLVTKFKDDKESEQKLKNLKAYYNIYLAYGCEKQSHQELRNNGDKKSPVYECMIRRDGCRNDNDCHYVFGKIISRFWGDSAVYHTTEKQADGTKKKVAKVQNSESTCVNTWTYPNTLCKVSGAYGVCVNHVPWDSWVSVYSG